MRDASLVGELADTQDDTPGLDEQAAAEEIEHVLSRLIHVVNLCRETHDVRTAAGYLGAMAEALRPAVRRLTAFAADEPTQTH